MKVLIVPGWYPSSQKPDHGDFVFFQAKELVKRGLDVAVIYADLDFRYFWKQPGKSRITQSFDIENGIPTFRLSGADWPKTNAYFMLQWAKQYELLFLSYQKAYGNPDILHAHTFLGGFAAMHIAKTYNLPYLITEHASAFLTGRIKRWWKPLIKKVYNDANAVIAVSKCLKDHLAAYYTTRLVEVIPNFIDTDLFSPIATSASRNAGFDFLAAGNFIPLKRYDLLIKAFAKALPFLNANSNLTILGNGPERKRLINLIKKLGIEGKVSLPGKFDNSIVAEYMQNSNALVLCSEHETFGIVIAEAMASGLPVIATRCCGPETIVTPDTGILVPKNDVAALSESLVKMVINIDRYDSNSIRQYAIKNFGAETVARKTTVLYERIIGTTAK